MLHIFHLHSFTYHQHPHNLGDCQRHEPNKLKNLCVQCFLVYEIKSDVFNAVDFPPKSLDAQTLVLRFNGGQPVATKSPAGNYTKNNHNKLTV